MSRTVTLRLDDEAHNLIKSAALDENRPIANFLENAALAYIRSEAVVSDEEMEGILTDPKLVASLKRGLADAKKGRYRIVD